MQVFTRDQDMKEEREISEWYRQHPEKNVAVGNPRLPPYPHTVTVLPLDQLRLATALERL